MSAGGSTMNCYYDMLEIESRPLGYFDPGEVKPLFIMAAVAADLASRLAYKRSIFFYLYFYHARSDLIGFSLFALPLLMCEE